MLFLNILTIYVIEYQYFVNSFNFFLGFLKPNLFIPRKWKNK